jgi:hypothetical protein
VATPLNHSLRYPTRSNPQGWVDSFPEPERVYRRRINKLAPRRLLESLGEEAISDIHLLFAHNNPTTTMGDPLSPCNFANIQGYPHPVPDKAIEKLPSFQGNNDVSARSHIVNFNMCSLKWCNGHCCRPNTHLGYRGRNLQSTWCVLGGKSRVKVLSPDPRLLRLGQLLAKPRGVVPIKIKLRLSKLTKKENFILGVYCLK